MLIWKPSLQRQSQGLVRWGLLSTSSACVHGEDSRPFSERQSRNCVADVWLLAQHWEWRRELVSAFSFPTWTIREAVKKNSYCCFPYFHFLCVQREKKMGRGGVPNRNRKQSWIARKVNYQLMTLNIGICPRPQKTWFGVTTPHFTLCEWERLSQLKITCIYWDSLHPICKNSSTPHLPIPNL